MTQKRMIARAGRSLLDVLKLLLRGVWVLCAAIGSLFLTAMSYYEPEESVSDDGDTMPDGLSLVEREEVAELSGWKSW